MRPRWMLGIVLAAGAYATPVPTRSFPNILLVTIDTLRADHVSCYGYHLETTPVLDRLAAEGVRFARAYTTIPQTGPAHISLFTSTYPQQHGSRINGVSYNAKARLLFLPQVLRRYGYRTAAFVSAWPLIKRLTNLDVWFDDWDEQLDRRYQLFNTQRWAEDVTPRVSAWLHNTKHQPFFLWVHYFDPHEPYDLREAFARLKQVRAPALANGPAVQDPEMQERVRAYDSEVAYADHYLGQLLSTLHRLGLAERTIVVVLADHGESLGEHNYVGHGRHLYEHIVQIPFIIRYPGVIPPGRVVREPVSLLDVMPTLLELALERNGESVHLPFPLEGKSLVPALTGNGSLEPRTLYFLTYAGKKGFLPNWFARLWVDEDELPLRLGRVSGDSKVIWTPSEHRMELYELARDPEELSPSLPVRTSPRYRSEQLRLERWYRMTAGQAGQLQLTEKDVQVLRSLGYLH